MNIQLAFIYCFITIIMLYVILWIDNRYVAKTTDVSDSNQKILRTSILCGLIVWIIIVYFIYRAEQEVPHLMSNNLAILQDNF